MKKTSMENKTIPKNPRNNKIAIKNQGEIIHYQYKCVKCAECCRYGLKIEIEKDDVERWRKLEKEDFLQHIQLDPFSIRSKDDPLNKKDGKAVKKIRKDTRNEKELRNRLDELISFIKKTHKYFGKNRKIKKVNTILPSMHISPILNPKNFLVILKGLDRGIVYDLAPDTYRACPFLDLNRCTIYSIRPIACRAFPYNSKGNLRKDIDIIRICRGFKRI